MTKKQKEKIENEIILLDKKDVQELTGWGENTVAQKFAYDEEFPAIKIGRKYQIEAGAFLEYLRSGRKVWIYKKSKRF